MPADSVFTTFPQLETPRLILREIRPEDAADIFATFSDEAVMKFYGQPVHQTIEDSREQIAQLGRWYAAREGIRWGIIRRGEDAVIGSCGLYLFDDGFHRAETGYELRRAYWWQGIMSEAMTAMLTFGFETMSLHRIEAVVDDVNEASKGLLRALGFTHEGTLRQRFYFREHYLDEHYFGLLREEWGGRVRA